MKKALAFILVLATVITLLSIPVFAADEDDAPKDGLTEFLSDAKSFFSTFPESVDKIIENLDTVLSEIKGISETDITAPDYEAIEDGGIKHENTAEKDTPYEKLNGVIASIYNITYPIGLVVMLLCWTFGMVKSTISSSLDIKDRGSIVRAVLNLIIGLIAVSVAPQILTVLTGASEWLYSVIFSEIFPKVEDFELKISTTRLTFHFLDISRGVLELILLTVVQFVLTLNIVWIALLQSLSPIFIGCFGSEGTRKIGMNFVKEYLKALLVPSITIIYYVLSYSILGEPALYGNGLITAIVLGISMVSIASKKLDKLIN